MKIPNMYRIIFFGNNNEMYKCFSWRHQSWDWWTQATTLYWDLTTPSTIISCFTFGIWNNMPFSSKIVTNHIGNVFELWVWCEEVLALFELKYCSYDSWRTSLKFWQRNQQVLNFFFHVLENIMLLQMFDFSN